MLFPRNEELWVRTHCDAVQLLEITISDTALSSACDGVRGEIGRSGLNDLADPRVRALVDAVNAERMAAFPGGKLFLDSVERALTSALVDCYATPRTSARTYRGGLGPARLRRVTELVHSKLENELTLQEMAKTVELSVAHFSQMFRKSTGQSPHQFVLRHRIERAKEMLRAAETRALDVAVACGFKTQQHFSRVFRQISGVTPREYRHEFQSQKPLQSL
jgi:AraC family transcriptional regulator